MPLVTVRFDRVFDVVKGEKDHKVVTFFGFESAHRKFYGVPGPGDIELPEGREVTAFLQKEDDWQSLLGWVVRDTGEIVSESVGYEVFMLAFCAGFAFFALWGFREAPVIALVVIAGLALLAASCLMSMARVLRSRSRLKSIRRDQLQRIHGHHDAS
jgi:hypothetical protein